VWLEKASQAGFEDVTVLERSMMSEERLTRYPVYREGGLDGIFALVTPEERWRLVESATIRAVKAQRNNGPRTGALVCEI
jgi:hypothetical protein